MDKVPDPAGVPSEVLGQVVDNYQLLCNEWDKMYPNNPIRGNNDDENT